MRSSVDQWEGFKKKPVIEHGKLFYIAGAKQSPSGVSLVNPVNEAAMLEELRMVLKKRGFVEAVGDQTPQIVLTVMYGRGLLKNPYLEGGSFSESPTTNTPNQPPSLTIPGAWALILNKEHEPGYQAKMEKGNMEKLFIHVMAWQYPKPAKGKPKQLWKTTMIVDDPENRDLNLTYKEMFASGAAFFDRPIEVEEEVSLSTPTGHVEVGSPTVVESPDKRK
ncbi:MAG: hypothetical protein JWM32_1255 [Verrucomicrobia bacterium]|nr:hypothetical protein [Verrucomicrobiota bacterium]